MYLQIYLHEKDNLVEQRRVFLATQTFDIPSSAVFNFDVFRMNLSSFPYNALPERIQQTRKDAFTLERDRYLTTLTTGEEYTIADDIEFTSFVTKNEILKKIDDVRRDIQQKVRIMNKTKNNQMTESLLYMQSLEGYQHNNIDNDSEGMPSYLPDYATEEGREYDDVFYN